MTDGGDLNGGGWGLCEKDNRFRKCRVWLRGKAVVTPRSEVQMLEWVEQHALR